jgi:hypothetical protein
MTPAGAPTMFVIDDDAAVRAEQALVHKASRAKTGGVINLTRMFLPSAPRTLVPWMSSLETHSWNQFLL